MEVFLSAWIDSTRRVGESSREVSLAPSDRGGVLPDEPELELFGDVSFMLFSWSIAYWD